MTDDLILRLLNCYNLLEDEGHYVKANAVHLAIGRIKALEKENTEANAGWEQTSIMLGRQLARAMGAEAKLAKAVEALREIADAFGCECGDAASATLAEIEGDKR